MLNLEIIIDDVHFAMVDKHHTYPTKDKDKIILRKEKNYRLGKVLL
jgi:hypothetical protein